MHQSPAICQLDSFLAEVSVEVDKDAACYFPPDCGRYEVKPGLMPLGVDLGNDRADKQVFQIDSNFAPYRQAKLFARAECLSKYCQTYSYCGVAGAIAHLIITRLIREYPQYFHLERLSTGNFVLHCHLTAETLYLDADWQLQQAQSNVIPAYISTLDALASQVQEDLAVVCRGSNGENWLRAIHLCYPNHWAAEDKIGKDFALVHAPVAGMEKINQRAGAIVNTMIERKPMVRFAWGLSTDTRLNHHPKPPLGISVEKWQGREFNLDNPRLYLRIERQTIWGLPKYDAALFTIRTYFRDCRAIKQDAVLRPKLVAALDSMTADSLVYKGLAASKSSILRWLNDENLP
ncbi:heme-dependent oxidative N-demethylase family protein [Aliterella atlantica]|uniref:DUF3445 domain-containing protein n=1 Tax=Aliterella atlantica CENA595 TaxID=1618023 RepID=A0A0D8ZMH9_9CYAN|nr:DUF3445 domain-containing protein [Aliterella atlantica]KJH69567.1 hypothetical protein UH38_23140 [Aliterella atlantica CENA595]